MLAQICKSFKHKRILVISLLPFLHITNIYEATSLALKAVLDVADCYKSLCFSL